MFVTESSLPHICQFDGAFTRCVHEPVATYRMELRSCDDFSELFHVRRLDIDNVEALILDIEVPEVYPQVIRADVGFSIAVDGYAIDVIGVCVGVDSPRHSSNNRVVMCHTREFEIRDTSEVVIWETNGASTVGSTRSGRSEFG